jgi:competence protein ComGC
MKTRGHANLRRQQGATLLVGMIMLVVLTLLVVFAIRSSNTGLQVAGNMQAQVESNAAVTKALETTIQLFKDTEDVSLIPAQTVSMAVGDKTFSVAVAKPTCEMEIPVLESELDAADANDVPCIEGSSGFDPVITASGALATKPSACKQQRWKIEATFTDANSGAAARQVQGIGIRVPVQVSCPT